jgi:hypothetical protein
VIPPPTTQCVVREKKKKLGVVSYDCPVVKWAVVNRVQLDLNCSGLHEFKSVY